jgi:glucose/arabinose dehydrogenase
VLAKTTMRIRADSRGRVRTVAIAWWIVSWAAMVLIPAHLRFGALMWALPSSQVIQVLAVGTAFLIQAVLVASTPRNPLWRALAVVAGWNVVCFGAALLLLALYPPVETSRLFFLYSILLGTALASVPFLIGRALLPAAVLLLVGLIIEVSVGAEGAKGRIADSTVEDRTVTTTLHRLSLEHYAIPQNPANVRVRGGGFVAYGKDLLLVTGAGEFFRLRWDADGPLQAIRLPFSAPLEQAPYAAAPTEFNDALLIRVTGIALDASPSQRRLFLAYDHWYQEKNCFTARVSALNLSEQLEQTPQDAWQQIFEAQPCIPVSTGFDNLQTGGRLAISADGKLLLSLGDHGINGLNSPSLAQDPNADFGKILVLDRNGGRTILSVGHRNPQGLTVDSHGRIWETEHGPQGGDELNLIASGGNYGWPLATYGADYGYETWPIGAPNARDHGDFVEPHYAFLPSVGISSLLEVRGATFARWEGDLLIGSLRAESLFRVRLRGDNVSYVERIPIGRRVRDIIQGEDGRILMWSDRGDVTVIKPASAPRVYEYCSGCHESSGGIRALGPSLRNVVGRPIASEFEYPYSQALSQLQGEWSEENLDAFIRSPSTFAPGTKMTFGGIADADERAAIIQFLRHYHNVPH